MLQAHAASAQLSEFFRQQPPTSSSQHEPHQSAVQTVNAREDYNKETDGKPCYPWNWGKDFGFQRSHGTHPDLHLHVCAWCAYRFKRQLNHKEQDCMKKKRFLEKKASGDSTPTNTVSEEECNYHVSHPQCVKINNGSLANTRIDTPHHELADPVTRYFMWHGMRKEARVGKEARGKEGCAASSLSAPKYSAHVAWPSSIFLQPSPLVTNKCRKRLIPSGRCDALAESRSSTVTGGACMSCWRGVKDWLVRAGLVWEMALEHVAPHALAKALAKLPAAAHMPQ